MFTIETEQEPDSRWVAESPTLPGALAHAATIDEARASAAPPALRAIAEPIECGEAVPVEAAGLFAAA